MLATKIIFGIYTFIKNGILRIYYFSINFNSNLKVSIANFNNYIADFKYRLNNLASANFELGIYHLNKYNLNDALIRFKLVDKFLTPGDPRANYYLGWTYFLKNNLEKSVHYLEKSNDADVVKLKPFLKDLNNYSEVPEDIWQQCRTLMTNSPYYLDSFRIDKLYLPTIFVQKTLHQITDLPNNYNILEIGSGIGLLGTEVKKRFPDNCILTGIEGSDKMVESIEVNDPDKQIYDRLIHSSLQNFKKNYFTMDISTTKFDVILSLCGLTFTKNLNSYFNFIHSILDSKGYFAFCLPTASQTIFSLKRKEFLHNIEEIRNILLSSGFNLLSFEELKLGIRNKYSIVVVRKNFNKL